MTKRRSQEPDAPEPLEPDSKTGAMPRPYRRASRLAVEGRHDEARRRYLSPKLANDEPWLRDLVANDLAVLSALEGDRDSAQASFQEAVAVRGEHDAARLNLALMRADGAGAITASSPEITATTAPSIPRTKNAPTKADPTGPVRVAILSMLFNWPSTGGGTVHTAELARSLARAGYEVGHFYARHLAWGVGSVAAPTPHPSEGIDFDDESWNPAEIRARFRRAVDAFVPDYVIITDSWNTKPLLAEAVRGYPYIMRLQALECLCPLNNVRLLPDTGGRARQCQLHQFASRAECSQCVTDRALLSGSLHQAERALAGTQLPDYHDRLLRAFGEAEAVLVVNPLTEAMLSPYARSVRVVTAGMDSGRFPWPPPPRQATPPAPARKQLLFAGLVDEWMKGFHVLHEACELLWKHRQDFELIATAEPIGQVDEFTRYVGWQSQEQLPSRLYEADVLIMPTIAQEALGRTAVEAMAAGRPVIASRIGGLSFTVADGATGLLVEPGDADDLARKIEQLLDDPELCQQLGRAGRRRYEDHYDWDVIIDRHYRPLLRPRTPSLVSTSWPSYAPFIPARVDHEALIDHAAEFFGLSRGDVAAKLQVYGSFHKTKGYARTLGELKTLCFEEAFLIYLELSLSRPRTLVEIGTQHGKSTRRMLDIVNLLGLGTRVVCIDVVDEVRHFDPVREAELIVADVTDRFRDAVLRAYEPQLVFLDVHAHGLLTESITEILNDAGSCHLAIHDCGRGLCNPRMTIGRDDPDVTSLTGVWERHVMAEIFGVADPLSNRLDACSTATHRMRIFDTPHGLALIKPQTGFPNEASARW